MKANIYNFKAWIDEIRPEILFSELDILLKEAGFQILNFVEHRFEPQGYTAVWILAESHLAIHTFPEAGKTYIELSSCNEEKNLQFQKGLGKTKNINVVVAAEKIDSREEIHIIES